MSNSIKFTSLALAILVFFTSCMSTTIIQSEPPGALVYINGEKMGKTPYFYSDEKIVGTVVHVKLQKEGYEDLTAAFSRTEEVNVGALIGGLFIWLPLLWVMNYKPIHNYELTPLSYDADYGPATTIDSGKSKLSKADRLIALKDLLDRGILTQEEFDIEKKKILEEEQ